MSRVELAKISSLKFYKGEYTAGRRTSPLPQLVCHGTPCKLYQPEVVRCVNLGGGVGTDVDWKCDADLPEALRFGKVEVSCEGWSKPGDPYVLKGSCSLDYRLVEVPGALRDNKTDKPIFRTYNLASVVFMILWVGFLFFILYNIFLSCFRNNTSRLHPPASNSGPRPGGSSGWFPGDHSDGHTGPPPPYSKNPTNPTNERWRPGFWTGALFGGVANHLWNGQRQAEPRPTTWDWERDRTPRTSWFGGTTGRRIPSYNSHDRGEGSSNLGSMRRSTGLGGSNVR